MCAHWVNRKGYWSLEESYRDERARPRKRVLRYIGKMLGIPSLSFANIEPNGSKYEEAAYDDVMVQELDEALARDIQANEFHKATGLDLPEPVSDLTPMDKSSPAPPAEPEPTQEPTASEPSPDPTPEAPSEAAESAEAAPGGEDAGDGEGGESEGSV